MTVNKWIKNRIFAIAIFICQIIFYAQAILLYAVTVFANQNDYAHTEVLSRKQKELKVNVCVLKKMHKYRLKEL